VLKSSSYSSFLRKNFAFYLSAALHMLFLQAQMRPEACKEKVKPQIGLAARKFGRRGRKRSAAQISHHKVPA